MAAPCTTSKEPGEETIKPDPAEECQSALPDGHGTVTDRLLEMLDHIENRVESMRTQALSIEKEKENLLVLLNSIQESQDLHSLGCGVKEDIQAASDRLIYRCLTVDVVVTIPRNELQESALRKVCRVVDDIAHTARNDTGHAKEVVKSYLNACLPEVNGPVNQQFQSMIIDCAGEDQKRVRKRLESLAASLDTLTISERKPEQKQEDPQMLENGLDKELG